MKKISLMQNANPLEESLRIIRKEIQNIRLADVKKIPKSPKEMTPKELADDTLRRTELCELLRKQESIQNKIAIKLENTNAYYNHW